MAQPIDAITFRETLQRVQQEREHYRLETARLRTENASLLNEIDALKAQLSDVDGQQVFQAAASEDYNTCADRTPKRMIEIEDADSNDESSCCTPLTDVRLSSLVRDHRIENELSETTKNIDEPIHNVLQVRVEDQSESLGSAKDDEATAFDHMGSDVLDARGVLPSSISLYSTESLSYPFYRGRGDAKFLTLSAERIAGCLEDISHISCDSPGSPVEVSRHFLSQITRPSAAGISKLMVTTPSGHCTMRRVLWGSESLYFPLNIGSPGLLLSGRKEIIKGSYIWSCFAPVPVVSSKQMLYMGDYSLSYIDDLSPEEYNLQKPHAKKRAARLMFDPPRKEKGLKRSHWKVEDDAVNGMVDAFAVGQEKIHIIAMEFANYDVEFAEDIRARYTSWLKDQVKA
ncbi:hypothetical protein HYDPIDRAFT_110345 [Hydnomerulius pinastri MD-312]|nr:hypothetical protein HYDPIDRAFT_110345 [Hydnomerulius pinastri MD-312]